MSKRSREEWDRVFESFFKSGLSQRAYCKQYGVNIHAFAWQKQHNFKGTTIKSASSDFIPLSFEPLPTQARQSGGIEMRIGEVASLYIDRDTDPQLMRMIIEAVSACGRT